VVKRWAATSIPQEGDRVAYPQSPVGSYADLRGDAGRPVVRLPAKITFEQALQ